MSVKQKEHCRLCLRVAQNLCKNVDETTKLMLGMLMLKLDFDITSDPIVCQECMEVAKKCLDFKYTFIKTERDILSFSLATKKAKHDLKVICKEGEDVETEVADDNFSVCRFCMTQLRRSHFFSWDVFMNDTIFGTLSEYLPEMDFNIIENFTVCATCRESLEDYLQFIMNCLDVEAKIIAYCVEERRDYIYQIKLSDVLPKNISVRNKDVSKINSLKCPLCAYESKYKCRLETHLVVHKDVSEIKMFKCSLCTNEYKYKKNLARHNMLVHKDASEIKMFKCSLCAYESKHKSSLARHILIHKDVSEIKMLSCSLCAYKTKYKANHLDSHMLVHKDISEIKMFSCSLCVNKYKHRNSLREHMLSHRDVSEKKMYTCSLCAYKNKRKRHIETHMLVHKDISEIKLFACPVCAKVYKHKSSLKAHMWSKHPETDSLSIDSY